MVIEEYRWRVLSEQSQLGWVRRLGDEGSHWESKDTKGLFENKQIKVFCLVKLMIYVWQKLNRCGAELFKSLENF